MKNSITVFLILTTVLMLFACGNHKKHAHDADGNHIEAKAEFASAYVCPMHCEGSGSDEAGTCPVCNMDYVALKEHKADGHHHEGEGEHDGDHHEHDGHEHDDHNHEGEDHQGHNHN